MADELLRRHSEVHRSKGAAPWVERRGERLDLGVPRAELAYRPSDSQSAVEPHVFRLASLQRVAKAIRAAGVHW